jgi:hypothetical protein
LFIFTFIFGSGKSSGSLRIRFRNIGFVAEDRLLVLYTGKPRLAKNLLQNVIRNWYGQDPDILASFANNFRLAETCWAAVQERVVA